jgi:hypothetical protein
MDTYTKVILTVIAIALSVIALQNTRVVRAFAQNDTIQRVIICDAPGIGDLNSGCARVAKGGLIVHTQ